MENKQLEGQHLKAIEADECYSCPATDGFESEIAAKACSFITLEHMEEFGIFIRDNVYMDEGEYYLNSNHELKTTEELINLYFESLNKKS